MLASPELVGRPEVAAKAVEDSSTMDVERLAAMELFWLVDCAAPDDEIEGISKLLAAPRLVGKLELFANAVEDSSTIDVERPAATELLWLID